jgi:hypothetical protein
MNIYFNFCSKVWPTNARLHSLFISVNRSKCFGWIPHPSSGAQHYIYSIWYLSNRNCYLPQKWQVAVTVWQIPDAVETVLCSWWWVGDPPETCRAVYWNIKLCYVASCWSYFGIHLRRTAPWTSNLPWNVFYDLYERICWFIYRRPKNMHKTLWWKRGRAQSPKHTNGHTAQTVWYQQLPSCMTTAMWHHNTSPSLRTVV